MFTGDGFYRHHEPSRFLARLPGVTVVDCHATHRFLWPLVNQADVLILPVISGWELFPLIEKRRAEGKITVLETNDYFHEMQPWNPIAELWLDPDTEFEHLEYIKACDAIQTSTDRLADHWQGFAKAIAVFPNQLSSVPPLSDRPPGRPLTIGYAGSQGHLADWFVTAQIIQPWLDAHPEVNVAVMTHASGREFLRLPSERYAFIEGGVLADYMEFLKRLDIGLAPLLPTEYNRCRSDVKHLEYAVSGVVGIYSSLGPYNGTVRDGETGFLYDTPEQLLNVLDELVANESKRESVRREAYEEIAGTRRIEDHIETRLAFYRSLLKCEEWEGELPEEMVEASEIDGRYYRLISQDFEKAVFQTLQETPSEENAERLLAVVKRFPSFVSCARATARLLNDVGKPQQSLAVSGQLQMIAPGTAQTASEIGRSYFLLGQYPAARQHLQEAVETNPRHILSWSYLLRFTAKHFPQELPSIIARMRSHVPQSYKLALLAARLSGKQGGVLNMRYLLRELSTNLNERQLRVATSEIASALETILGESLEDPDVPPVLEQASAILPSSAKVATLYGRALIAQGRTEAGLEALRRAHALFESAREFAKEYTPQDSVHYIWQIAQALRSIED